MAETDKLLEADYDYWNNLVESDASPEDVYSLKDEYRVSLSDIREGSI